MVQASAALKAVKENKKLPTIEGLLKLVYFNIWIDQLKETISKRSVHY